MFNFMPDAAEKGEPAAKYLKERFGTPYLMMRPYGIDGTPDWLSQIEEQFKLYANKPFILQERKTTAEQIQAIQTWVMYN